MRGVYHFESYGSCVFPKPRLSLLVRYCRGLQCTNTDEGSDKTVARHQRLTFTVSSSSSHGRYNSPCCITASLLTPLVTALSSLSTSSSIGCLSAPTHPSVPIACSVAFFHKGNATPFSNDIPGAAGDASWKMTCYAEEKRQGEVFGRE